MRRHQTAVPAESTPTSSDGPKEQLADLYWTGLFMGRASENFKRFSRSNRADVDGLFADPPPLSDVTDVGQVVYWWPAIKADACESPNALSALEALVLSPFMDFTYKHRGIAGGRVHPRDLARFIKEWLSAYLWFAGKGLVSFLDAGNDLPVKAQTELDARCRECVDLLDDAESLEPKFSDRDLAEDVIRLFVTPTIDWCKSAARHAHWLAGQRDLSVMMERVESRMPLFVNDPAWERLLVSARSKSPTLGSSAQRNAEVSELICKVNRLLDTGLSKGDPPRGREEPAKILTGWKDILASAGMKHSEANVRKLKRTPGCPVVVGRKGQRPWVRLADLDGWFDDIFTRHNHERKARSGPSIATLPNGETIRVPGSISPIPYRHTLRASEIAGSIRRRRRPRAK
jgi:hypothetical protein